MKIYNVKAQIIVTEGCMTEFYDNDPQKVCDEIRRVMYKKYVMKLEELCIKCMTLKMWVWP
jgi:hypothetical protein